MTSLRQRMLEDMQVRGLSPRTQQTYVETVARFARHFGRSPARLGLEEIRAYQVYLTNERRLASSSLVVAVSALRFLYRVTLRKRWVLRRRDPRAEEVPLPAGRAQPGRSGPVPRRGEGRQASRHPDHVLRRRPAHLRGRQPHGVRHRQRTDGAPHREGQGAEGPLRDALAEAARGPARLVAGRPAAALALSRRAPGEAGHSERGRACLPRRRPPRAPRQAGFAPCAPACLCGPSPRGGHRPADDSAPARPSEPADHGTVPAGRDHHGLLDREPARSPPTARTQNAPRTSTERRPCHAPRSPWRRSSAATATPSGLRPEPPSRRRSAA